MSENIPNVTAMSGSGGGTGQSLPPTGAAGCWCSPAPPPPGTPPPLFHHLRGHLRPPWPSNTCRLASSLDLLQTWARISSAWAWWALEGPGVPRWREKGSTAGRHIPRTTILPATTNTLVGTLNHKIQIPYFLEH